MDIVQLKTQFHHLIDDIQDQKLLNEFYKILTSYKSNKQSYDIIDELTDVQKNRLSESMEQYSAGKTISDEEMKSEIKKWLTK
ncbi:MAG: hypothetical protein A3K10_14250 [Bacteroidetes bacterium RIFCSPLOWO2_12_FULL_31_6]|nr:MAG: hypothetical protein A3K10_14250 [Bacteroidetes bacterium RIFCSPLOWO2_12_FULL_31_6]